MVQNLYDAADAQALVERLGPTCGEDLALRVYTSRLIGKDPGLVLHGGGNTSVKTTVHDTVLGEDLDVLCVKGSGWDLATIEPAGLPAVRLEPLRRLRGVSRLGDEDMVHRVRAGLLDPAAPTPSVETLLHAFLPHRFIDHTHADAICVLTNQPDGAALIREALGDRTAVLPWIMPGHPLAEAVADAWEAMGPDCEAVVLLHHGIFTFADDAETSYARMIACCDRAERFAATRATRTVHGVPAAAASIPAEQLLPALRGAVALDGEDGPPRFLVDARTAPDLVAFSRRSDAADLCATGPLTPDHVLRTKGPYLYVRREDAADADRLKAVVGRYADSYRAYFEAHRDRVARPPVMLDPSPRVAVVEGFGLCAFGEDAKAARIAADIAEHTLRGKALAASIGSYTALPDGDLFDMEYWSLEQAKLGRAKRPPLAGQVALVTGGGGAIGCGIADELLRAGAHVVLADRAEDRLDTVQRRLVAAHGSSRVAVEVVDVTDEASVERCLARTCARFGGVDIVVPNAGVAHVATLEDMDVEDFRRVVDVNLTGTLLTIRAATPVLRRQGTGGAIVLQGSKNVPAPGAGFGAYSASKAGATQLARVAALELASIGVTVNTVHADAVFGDDEVPSGLWEAVGPDRMRARGLDPDGLRAFYRDRSLLRRSVRPADVGRAVVFFAQATRTTGATLTVDAGVAEAFPR
ncbi:MAG: bifunctional aldolase/short-chain dehydrogenase [Planctomycetota bacterium]